MGHFNWSMRGSSAESNVDHGKSTREDQREENYWLTQRTTLLWYIGKKINQTTTTTNKTKQNKTKQNKTKQNNIAAFDFCPKNYQRLNCKGLDQCHWQRKF